MAFLDNSGDIILDAVLTDVGRRRMANGNFQIRKFALGDDEINYAQYVLDHPSGSAYSDLEILQTPIFEAVTAENSAVNYGLLAIARTDLLYLPTLKFNYEMNDNHAVRSYNKMVYLAVNEETLARVKSSAASPPSALGNLGQRVLYAGMTEGRQLYFESGIDTPDHSANPTSRHNLITAVGMLDTKFTVDVDNRFITAVFNLKTEGVFSAPVDSTEPAVTAFRNESAGGSSTSTNLTDYVNYQVNGLNNMLYTPSGDREDPSVLAGPRGTAGSINFDVLTDMKSAAAAGTPNEFVKYGKLGQTVFGGSDTYDYIDTTVYIRGNSSTATAQIPIRIIRYAG